MDGVAGFAVHHSIDCNIEFRMAAMELAAICMAMDHIENETLGRYLILTDSMSSIRAM
jgi:ribonuclease HI